MTKMILFLLVMSLQGYAEGFAQQRVSLKLHSADVRTVLQQIERKSDYRFLFKQDLLQKVSKVDIDAENELVTTILSQVFKSSGIQFKVMNEELIVLSDDKFGMPIPKTITGKVTDAEGKPVPGASITVKGTKTGAAADNQGNFSITVPDNSVLVISAVGFESLEISTGNRNDFAISLKQISTANINEVVVIGYGTASRRDLTGSITKVAGKEVADKPNVNPIASLQSKVAGLYVVNNGTPGQEPDIRIRGTQSIGQVKPLYVVDGILQDNINYINPNDIESIEILKDPSSLAIFGVRGGTGVIAVTTKRGKAGQTTINFNSTYGFKDLVDKIKMASASQFDELFSEENATNGVPTPDYGAVKNGTNTDWIDAVTRRGTFQSHNLSVNASSEKNRINFGLGYVADEGIIRREKLEKILISFGDEFRVNKNIKFGANLNVNLQKNPYGADWVLDAARKVMPHISAEPKMFKVRDPYKSVYDSVTVPIYSGLVTALQSSGVANPLLRIENEWDKIINRENRYVGNFFTEIAFLKDFNFRATWYADMSYLEIRSFSPQYYAYNPMNNEPYFYTGTNVATASTSVTQTTDNYRKFQQDYILNYKKKIGDHSIGATAGFTTYYFGQNRLSATSTAGGSVTSLQIPSDKNKWFVSNNFGLVQQNAGGSFQREATTVSMLGRFLYNYQNKYYLTASIRDDASSRIPPKNQHQLFWALGAAWEVSREGFMNGIDQVNFLKIKASTGKLGNQSTYGPVGDYPFYPGIVPGSQVNFGTYGYLAVLPAYEKNPVLKWETIDAWEAGFEANLFSNRLRLEYNFYNKVTNDMMTYIGLASLGYTDIIRNGGNVKNWGHEITSSWTQPIGKNLDVVIGGNITFMKNKVVSLAEDLPGGVIIDARANNGSAEARTLPGQPIGSFFGYVVDGIYQTDLDRLVSPFAGSLGTYKNGDFKFKDVNGDGIISDLDRTVIGNPSPDFVYGANLGIRYKRFNFNVDLGGVYGNEVFRVWGALESPFQRVNYPALKINRWHGEGTSNWEPIISQARRFNYNGSTYNIEDGSYVRIRNIQIGYDMDAKKLLGTGFIKSLRFFANIQNLKTWKWNNGYTAEFGGTATAFGFDQAGGAIPRVTTFGLNANF